jgi:hypothetical protein
MAEDGADGNAGLLGYGLVSHLPRLAKEAHRCADDLLRLAFADLRLVPGGGIEPPWM